MAFPAQGAAQTTTPATPSSRELPAWLWLWAPFAPIAIMVATALADERTYRLWFKRKEGPLEWATVLVLVPGLVAAAGIWRRRRALPARWLGWWLALVGIGAFYYAGEEISWGQQIFGWGTPEFLAAINDQQETNLHNIVGKMGGGLFEQVPRFLLEQWILWGALAIPLATRRQWIRRGPRPAWEAWFWPTWCCVPAAALAILIRLPDRIDRLTGKQLAMLRDLRLSEPQEFYFALFLAIYLLSAWARLRRLGPTTGRGA